MQAAWALPGARAVQAAWALPGAQVAWAVLEAWEGLVAQAAAEFLKVEPAVQVSSEAELAAQESVMAERAAWVGPEVPGASELLVALAVQVSSKAELAAQESVMAERAA